MNWILGPISDPLTSQFDKIQGNGIKPICSDTIGHFYTTHTQIAFSKFWVKRVFKMFLFLSNYCATILFLLGSGFNILF